MNRKQIAGATAAGCLVALAWFGATAGQRESERMLSERLLGEIAMETEARTEAATEATTEAETTTSGGNEAKKWLAGVTIPTHTFIEETDAPTLNVNESTEDARTKETTTTAPETTTEAPTMPPAASTAPTAPETTTAVQITTEAPAVPNPPQNQRIICISDEDAELLVKTASSEAGNQGVYGMALIMRVVLNRSEQWGMSIHDVLYQPDQFNCVYGTWWANDYRADGVYEALEMIRNGWDESYGATFFCTPQRNTWHMSHLTFLYQYGNMQFYK